MIEEIVNWALEVYPNDTSILEYKLKCLVETDKQSAYELFKQNGKKFSPDIWLVMIKHFSSEPQITDIFDMIFGDKSVCENEVKQKLGSEYLFWLHKNKSLDSARDAYKKIILNSKCDPSVCKTLVAIETEQDKIDVNKIRQHFTLACMQFGKTNIGSYIFFFVFFLY